MVKTLKMTFNTEEGTRTLSIVNPKEEIAAEDVQAAMEAIVASGAFVGITGAVKAVMVESESTLIYEA